MLGYIKRYLTRLFIAFIIINIVQNGALLEQIKDRYQNYANISKNMVILESKDVKKISLQKESKSKVENEKKVVIDENVDIEYSIYRDNQPVFWCKDKIDVEINNKNMPEGANNDLIRAFGEIRNMLGINFNVVGFSNDTPSVDSYLRKGGETTPVLIGWSTPEESDLLLKGASGGAVSNPALTTEGYRLVTGAVAYNIDHNNLYAKGIGDGMSRVNLYVHELLHVLGLGHSEKENNIMYTHISEKTNSISKIGNLKFISESLKCVK
jgi:hypothetical protein